MTTSRRGFSLMEILVVMGIMAMMGGLAMVNGRGALSNATSRALADRLAAEIRQARAEAVRDNVPVALVFPSSNDHSQGLYVLRGHQRGLQRRQVDWSSEARGVGLFWGYWGLADSITEGNDNRLPATAGRGDAFNPSSWGMPVPSDAALIFTPSGGVVSNGLVHFDGAYHIVAASGLTAATSGPPGGGVTTPLVYRVPSALSDPVTVTVSFRGDVKVSKGLVGNDGSVAGGGNPLGAASPLPDPTTSANSDPVVAPEDVEVLPKPTDPSLLPAGVLASVDVNRYLTIKVAASDPDGDTLFTDWTCGGQGRFAASGRQAMEWSPQRNRWEGSMEWRPPGTATDGQVFTLNCTVTDGRGGSVVLGGDVVTALKVVTLDQGLLVVSERYSSRLQLFNSDGSGLRELTLPDSVCTMSTSADGERLVFSFWGGPMSGAIASMNLDNEGLRILATPGGFCEPRVAASGRIALTSGGVVATMNGDGSNLTSVTTLSGDEDPIWAPDESALIFNRTSTGKLMKINPDGTGLVTLVTGSDPAWDPGGTKVGFKRGNGIYTMNADGSAVSHIVSSGYGTGVGSLVYSPDGSKLAWLDPNDGSVYTCLAADGSGLAKIQSLPGASCIVWAR